MIDKKASFRTEHLGFVIFSNHYIKEKWHEFYNILKYIWSGLPLCGTDFISSKTCLFGFVNLNFVYYFWGVHICKDGFTHAVMTVEVRGQLLWLVLSTHLLKVQTQIFRLRQQVLLPSEPFHQPDSIHFIPITAMSYWQLKNPWPLSVHFHVNVKVPKQNKLIKNKHKIKNKST